MGYEPNVWATSHMLRAKVLGQEPISQVFLFMERHGARAECVD
jgi:hypothetical protein